MDGTKAALSYSFWVNGREFEVEQQVFRAYDSIRPREAQKILARYPVDALVQVYYDPEKPEKLHPRTRAAVRPFVLAGAPADLSADARLPGPADWVPHGEHTVSKVKG
jgi:hypothetical protein